MRKIYILPNLITSASLFCGMLAIFEIFKGDPRQACYLILLAALLDVSDGAIARLTKSASPFGLHLDSLADLVAFGVAPAVLAYHAFSEAFGQTPRINLAAAVCGLYAVCGALRLARFNVQSERIERKSFLGLPIPGAALGATSLIWVLSINPDLANEAVLRTVGPPAMFVLACLMISKVIYISFKQINFGERQPFEILVTIIFIGLILFMLKSDLDIVISLVSWVYILSCLVFSAGRKFGLWRRRRPADSPPAPVAGPHDQS